MNNSTKNNDIIAALATPRGRSAIAAIRISGNGCIEVVEKLLAKPLKTGKLGYNVFIDGGFTEKLMAVCFKKPHSYSGEDTIELYPHGNMTVCDKIIKALTERGVRIAERGEFTKRAFMNGKLDLLQCEALADIIDAQTEEQLFYGNKRFDGEYKALGEAEHQLNTALSTIEAVLHYGDELEENEIDERLISDVDGMIDEVLKKLKGEIDAFAGGRIVNDGFRVALIGAPNVGKSTILNALTDSDRAIVTEIAGTTRDTVDGEYVYKGCKFIITDTAGLTETDDTVEKIGIERAKKKAAVSDAVILVSACDCESVDVENLPESVFYVENKCDDIEDVSEAYKKATANGTLRISAKLNKNITALKQMLYDACPKMRGGICNSRQYACVLRCYDACMAAKAENVKSQSLEIVAAALYEAYSAIQELYGEKADEKVISTVFERFCVGK